MAKAKSRKTKSAEQVREEADEAKRVSLVVMGAEHGGGIPEHRVAGHRVHDFTFEDQARIKRHDNERKSVIRVLFPTIIERWFAEGGPGFDEPQRRAVEHCRELWHAIGDQGKLVANWDAMGGGSSGPRARLWEKAEAFAQLAEYEAEIPHAYWLVFENVVRFDMAAGTAGSHLAKHPTQAVAAARVTVGFVGSKIAEWRGY